MLQQLVEQLQLQPPFARPLPQQLAVVVLAVSVAMPLAVVVVAGPPAQLVAVAVDAIVLVAEAVVAEVVPVAAEFAMSIQ